MGMFDDLVPQAASTTPPSMFNDLIPKQQGGMFDDLVPKQVSAPKATATPDGMDFGAMQAFLNEHAKDPNHPGWKDYLRATLNEPAHMVEGMADLPKQVIGSSEMMRTEGPYDPEPVVAGAMTFGGVKMAKGVGGARLNAPETVAEAPKPVEPAAKPAEAVKFIPDEAPDTIRLYRGEGKEAPGAFHPGSSMTGGWFTTDINKARLYGEPKYVDVPKSEMGHFAQGHGGPDEYVTDNPKFRNALKPMEPAPVGASTVPPPPADWKPTGGEPPAPSTAAPAEAPGPIKQATAEKTPQALADDLQTLRQSSVADRAEIGNTIRALPEEAKTSSIGEKLYHAAEDPAEYAKLTPAEKAISDQHLDPLRQEQFDLALEAKKLGDDKLIDDPNYMHRIAEGHAPQYDQMSGSSDNPVTGTRGLPRTTSALRERKFYAIEEIPNSPLVVARKMPQGVVRIGKPGQIHADLVDPGANPLSVSPDQMGFATRDGKFLTRDEATAYMDKNYPNISNRVDGIRDGPKRQIEAGQLNSALGTGRKPVRKVITPNDNGITVWNNKTGTSVPTSAEIKPGEIVDLGGKPWKVVSARTKEIEQHGTFSGPNGAVPAKYHKNAFVNTADAVVRLREVVRNLKFLQEVKKSQWWLNHAQAVGGNRMAPKGWVRPKMPQLHDWYVDPKIAAVLDDFYRPGVIDPEGPFNALRRVNQFFTSSMFWQPTPHIQNVGVHWFVGRGWDNIRPGVARHFAADMSRAMKAVVTQNKDYQRFLREGGGLVYGGVKNADFYGELGRHMGMDIEKNWGAWKPLFDKLGLGASPAKAIGWWYGKMRNVLWASSDMFMMHRYLELERKGYSTARAIKDAERHIPNYRIPTTIMGSRAASKIAQEPAFTNFMRYRYGQWKSYMNMMSDLAKGTREEKKEALGNVASLAVMGLVIYPVLDSIYQKLTGDKDAKLLRRGAATVPSQAADVWNNRMSFSDFLQRNIAVAPFSKEFAEQFVDTDVFSGKHIGGLGPRMEHAAKTLASPYGTEEQVRGGGRSARRAVLDTLVGAENTSPKAEAGKRYAGMLRNKAAAAAEAHPKGLFDKGYYGAKKALKDKMRGK